MFGLKKQKEEIKHLKAMNKNLQECNEILQERIRSAGDILTRAEYDDIVDVLNLELDAAKKRQKSTSSKPSDYMKGLQRALEIVDFYQPHTIGGKAC